MKHPLIPAMARGVSALRPKNSPIFAFSNSENTIKHLRINHGVKPMLMTFASEPEETLDRALQQLVQRKLLMPGDKIVEGSRAFLAMVQSKGTGHGSAWQPDPLRLQQSG